MRDAFFSTRLTELLGIRHPILCGGMGPAVSDAKYVAAVVNAGGMGFIVAAGWGEDSDGLREQIKACRAATAGKPFGVNLYISRQSGGLERASGWVKVLREEGVACVETAGASPEPLLPLLREAGIKVLHKVPAVRYALSASRLDVDGIIVVGNECGGHPGIYQIGTMVQAAHAPMVIRQPVVVGGGIGTGRQLAAALAMGAEGVIMGTRMLVAEELWIHRDYKERIVRSDGTETVVVKQALRDHHRVFLNDSARAVMELDRRGETDFEAFRPYVSGSLTRTAYRTGDSSTGMLDLGHSAVFADAIEPVEAIFDRLIDDAVAAMQRLNAGLALRESPRK